MIGIESAHGFGDCCFNSSLIRAISDKYLSKVDVAVRPHCYDAFLNHPSIDNLIQIGSMGDGIKFFNKSKYSHIFQITQNIKFFEFKQTDPNHSLIDTPLLTGKQIGLDYDHKPSIYLTDDEYRQSAIFDHRPMIAIENIYTSAQSWSNDNAIKMIVDKYRSTHYILWLSNSVPPYGVERPKVSRRVLIGALQFCDKLFSVGSGFFCASLALSKEQQPKEIICSWIDDLYRYENRLNELKWHDNIKWVHNIEELRNVL